MTHDVDYGNSEDDDLTEPLDGRDSQAAEEGSSDNPEILDEVDPLRSPHRLLELDGEDEEPNPDVDLGYD
ncbi:hypothetical protein [Sinomonas susongensis]|uniref:hypothetical protein n=1 Tax=Sinomonas susongensis TaxID=1324851 RepID=UPI0011086344|nr:hypothetical protein [Sinomonas susongensis]